MTADPISIYRAYIACLNRRDWGDLPGFVHREVTHNGAALGVPGYRAMLERDVEAIPDLRFAVASLVGDASSVAARLLFDCRPRGRFLDLPVDGRRVRFAEHAFYGFDDGRIRTVWSIVDRKAIAAQLG